MFKTMDNHTKKYLPLLIIFSLLVFYFLNNTLWLAVDQCPPVSDEAYHLKAALDCYDILGNSSTTFLNKIQQLLAYNVERFYPPLYHAIAAFVGIFLGMDMTVNIMTNMLYIAISFISIYLIGKRIANEAVGVLAVFIFSMYPLVFWISRAFLIETALCAAVTAAMLMLLCTEKFTRITYSIIFGIVCAAGMLFKQVFIFSIAGPFIFTVIQALMTPRGQGKRFRVILTILIPVSFLAAVFYFWYLPKLHFIFPEWIDAAYTHTFPFKSPIFSLPSLMFYPQLLFNENLLPFFATVFFLSIAVLFFRKQQHKLFLVVWVISAWAIFFLIKTKYVYYLLSILPAAALITALFVQGFSRRMVRLIAVVVIVVFGLGQYFFISYGNQDLSYFNVKIGESQVLRIKAMPTAPLAGRTYPFPRRGNWRVHEILRSIGKGNSGIKKTAIGVTHIAHLRKKIKGVGGRDSRLTANVSYLRYEARLRDLPYDFIDLYDRFNLESELRNVQRLDFLLSLVTIEQLQQIGAAPGGRYKLVDVYQMPDQSEVYLYKNEE